MVNDLNILPKSTLSALTPEKSSPPSNKPSTSAQQKSSTTSSSSVSKPPSSTSKSNMSKPSKTNQDTLRTRSQPKSRVQLGKEGLPSASTYNKKSRKSDDEEIFETRVSDSEVLQLVDYEKTLQGKKKSRKTRERKITVNIGQPSISLSNKFEKLEVSTDETCPEEEKMEEKMEEEQSDGSDCESPWVYHRPECNKNLDSWQTSTAETKCVEKTHM